MPQIVNPEIESYLLRYARDRDPLHDEIENYAAKKSFRIGKRKIAFPIVGPLVGRIIFQLTRLKRAQRVLELGSGFGYSAYWFARALGKGGELILTDGSRENLEQAGSFLSRIENAPKIYFHCGDALEMLDKIPGDFDIVFNDINKHQYPQAFRKVLPRIRSGGLLIADNVLWSGLVLNEKSADRDTRGIQEFNRLIFSNPDLMTTILPVRDGLAVGLKV